jgi:hypothetical protein
MFGEEYKLWKSSLCSFIQSSVTSFINFLCLIYRIFPNMFLHFLSLRCSEIELLGILALSDPYCHLETAYERNGVLGTTIIVKSNRCTWWKPVSVTLRPLQISHELLALKPVPPRWETSWDTVQHIYIHDHIWIISSYCAWESVYTLYGYFRFCLIVLLLTLRWPNILHFYAYYLPATNCSFDCPFLLWRKK